MVGALTVAELRQCEARLLQRRAALLTALEGGTLSGSKGAAAAPIEVHDLKDDAFADLIAIQSNTALSQVHGELIAIDAALQRIEDGTYGSCTECQRDIRRGRLLVQPIAERCLPCQERAEGRPVSRSGPVARGRPLKVATRPRR